MSRGCPIVVPGSLVVRGRCRAPGALSSVIRIRSIGAARGSINLEGSVEHSGSAFRSCCRDASRATGAGAAQSDHPQRGVRPGGSAGGTLDSIFRVLPQSDPTGTPDRLRARQLPPAVKIVVGREREIARMRETIAIKDESSCRVVLLTGTAGAGKSTLALHALGSTTASWLGDELYVDLRGLEREPVSPAAVPGHTTEPDGPGSGSGARRYLPTARCARRR